MCFTTKKSFDFRLGEIAAAAMILQQLEAYPSHATAQDLLDNVKYEFQRLTKNLLNKNGAPLNQEDFVPLVIAFTEGFVHER